MKKAACIFLVITLLVSCDRPKLNFDKGIIPPVPVNFERVNSTYDDYNSDLDITWTEKSFILIFSTNRSSFGSDFDFISYLGRIEFDLIDGSFEMTAGTNDNTLITALNSGNNELGPFFTHDIESFYPWKNGGDVKRFFYCSDENGSLDILYCIYEFDEVEFARVLPVGDPSPVSVLNTVFDEGYLTIHNDESATRETVYFMSDREGSFDIWRATGEENMLINESSFVTLGKVTQLSSSADDKCPYIVGNMMVFTSDRGGGFGGFDLWYSVFNGQEWSGPVNMGEDINTEYDEYRPVVVSTKKEGFLNDLMVFSSDRPGGKGGFDLYYVGIPRRE
jgi:hypothetical protein